MDQTPDKWNLQSIKRAWVQTRKKQAGLGHCLNIQTSFRERDNVDEIIDQARADEAYIKCDASWRGNESHYIHIWV